MAYARTALFYACALAANAAAYAAPALPAKSDNNNKGVKKVQVDTIVVRRMHNAYFYPYNLWPLPKYNARDNEEFQEFPHIRSSNSNKKRNER